MVADFLISPFIMASSFDHMTIMWPKIVCSLWCNPARLFSEVRDYLYLIFFFLPLVSTLISLQMDSLVFADAANSHLARSSTSIESLDRVSIVSRTMKSGAFTATTYWGKRVITCECTEGIFDVPLSKTEAGDIPCDNFGHSLSEHASARLSEHDTSRKLMKVWVSSSVILLT